MLFTNTSRPLRQPTGQVERIGNQPQVEPLLERVTGHAAEPLGERLGVAVLAAGRDLRAARTGFQVASVHSIRCGHSSGLPAR